MSAPQMSALRGPAVSLRDNPFAADPARCLDYLDDALILMEGGVIRAIGPYQELAGRLPAGVTPDHYPDALLCPGFIDTHVHYPQLQMIGAYGEQLLEWLNRYTFPTEQQFADTAHADKVAALFLKELLRAGTTTALVYCTVHPASVEAFFAQSERLGTRMIAGKVLMDRNAPPALCDTAERGYRESKALIQRWHGRGRQLYCVTPRFAPTSTEAQLEAAGTLLAEHEGVFLQTHLCENKNEMAWVRELFPDRASYLDVYAHAGLVRPRAVFGHGVHLNEHDFCTCHGADAAIAHCPTSNLFLGSGLFPLFDAVDPRRPVRVGLGTDVGAGTSLSQLQSLNEAYKVAALSGHKLNAVQGLYLATLGGARALHLDDRLGRLAPAYEADICVLDPKATPLMAFRTGYCSSIEELLFALMTLGDDRAIRATYVAGRRVHDRDEDVRERP
ncbi:guanine deaminase [Xanthobacter sp. ZOL 2024]